jgi:hypothetical protein
MEITVFDWNWRITVMPKKATSAATTASKEMAPVVKKPAVPRVRKHVKAQAAVAAVEEFVSALVHPAKPKPEPTHEEVSRLAYRFYLERGGQNGSPAEDWIRAEQTLRG